MREPRIPPEDDGRTLADMSQVSRPALFGGLASGPKREEKRPQNPQPAPSDPEVPFTLRERWLFLVAALKAALLLAGTFLAGLGLVIAALLALWNLF